MNIRYLILILLSLIFSDVVIAALPLQLNKVEQNAVSTAVKEYNQSSKNAINYKVEGICMMKCPICFNGVSCDIQCVRETCINE